MSYLYGRPRRRRNGDFRFEIRIKTCEGNFVQRGSDMKPMQDWLKANTRGNYRTLSLGRRSYFDVRAVVYLNDLTDATAFKLYWSDDIAGQKDKGYYR